VARSLRAAGHDPEPLPLTTTGDRWSADDRTPAPDRGLFVKELEEALLDGRADLAVHSAKDLPGELPPGLAVVAVPAREDPRDVLVGPAGGLGALPAGARVATGSPRRAAQLLAARPDLVVVPIRGNVGTRLDKLARGEADALVLAAAGLRRLGLSPEGATPLAAEVCVPAPGQGLLAVEGRHDDPGGAAAAAALDDPAAHACLIAERALLAALGGGCMQPVGALCEPDGDGLRLTAFAGSEDGARADRTTL
jgi:hydroxymethylbilane synthase